MTATIDAALRDALREVNGAFVALPPQPRDRLEVDVSDADEAVTAALRCADEVAALDAIKAWRDGHLALIAEAFRSTRCRCSSPISSTDQYGDTCCIRCGRGIA